jgi:hypothetical protein
VCARSGWEADALIQFKNALGLEDADAAEAHVEVGRTIFRMRSETSSRDGEMAERGQFQKLVFLSNLVFGEAKARFLLPWKRLFNVSDAQVATPPPRPVLMAPWLVSGLWFLASSLSSWLRATVHMTASPADQRGV